MRVGEGGILGGEPVPLYDGGDDSEHVTGETRDLDIHWQGLHTGHGECAK